MNIKISQDVIAQGLTNAFLTIKTSAIWGVHKVQNGFSNHLVPLIKTLWSLSIKSLQSIQALIKSNPRLPFAAAAGLFTIGIIAFKIADQKAYEEDFVSRIAWKTLGIAAFGSATVAGSLGIVGL